MLNVVLIALLGWAVFTTLAWLYAVGAALHYETGLIRAIMKNAKLTSDLDRANDRVRLLQMNQRAR